MYNSLTVWANIRIKSNWTSATLLELFQNISVGNLHMGTFARQLSFSSLRNFRLGSFTWKPSLGAIGLGACVWDISRGWFRFGSFAWIHSFGIIRLGTFAWHVQHGRVRVGELELGTPLGILRLDIYAWDCSIEKCRFQICRLELSFESLVLVTSD